METPYSSKSSFCTLKPSQLWKSENDWQKDLERCVSSVNERKINQTHNLAKRNWVEMPSGGGGVAEIILSQVSFIYSKIQLLHGRKVVLLLLLILFFF